MFASQCSNSRLMSAQLNLDACYSVAPLTTLSAARRVRWHPMRCTIVTGWRRNPRPTGCGAQNTYIGSAQVERELSSCARSTRSSSMAAIKLSRRCREKSQQQPSRSPDSPLWLAAASEGASNHKCDIGVAKLASARASICQLRTHWPPAPNVSHQAPGILGSRERIVLRDGRFRSGAGQGAL